MVRRLPTPLAKHPKAFDQLFVNLVAAGEVGGILDTILQRLAAYIEKAEKLKKQIKGAMVYPITIMSIAVVVVGVILVFVIPTFAKMFADFGGELPAPTKIVIALSNFLSRYIIVIIAAFYGIIWLFKKYYATPVGQKEHRPDGPEGSHCRSADPQGGGRQIYPYARHHGQFRRAHHGRS